MTSKKLLLIAVPNKLSAWWRIAFPPVNFESPVILNLLLNLFGYLLKIRSLITLLTYCLESSEKSLTVPAATYCVFFSKPDIVPSARAVEAITKFVWHYRIIVVQKLSSQLYGSREVFRCTALMRVPHQVDIKSWDKSLPGEHFKHLEKVAVPVTRAAQSSF